MKVTIKVEIAIYAPNMAEAVEEFYVMVDEDKVLDGAVDLDEILPRVGGLLADASKSYDALNYGDFELPDHDARSLSR